MTPEETAIQDWSHAGKFTYKGLTYEMGVNEASAKVIIDQILNDRFTCSLDFLASNFDLIMLESKKAKGFTVGKGSQIHWYLNPNRNGGYKVYPYYENNEIGKPNYYESDKPVTIHY